MAEIKIKLTKAEMKAMEENANKILEQIGLNPDVVRYEQNLKIISDNIGEVLKRKESIKDELN